MHCPIEGCRASKLKFEEGEQAFVDAYCRECGENWVYAPRLRRDIHLTFGLEYIRDLAALRRKASSVRKETEALQKDISGKEEKLQGS